MGYAGVPCFWLEPTGIVGVSLRRYVRDQDHRCPRPSGYHDASTGVLWEEPLRLKRWRDGYWTMRPIPRRRRPGRRDPRWPRKCECGYRFRPFDVWQVNQAERYRRSDTGELVFFRGYGDSTMAGGLYDAWWLHEFKVECSDGSMRGFVGPDGIALVAICPNGAGWTVDGPAHDDGTFSPGGWSRSGDPRNPSTLTVAPSIVAGDYHGFLQGGRFTDG
jgi:hypothetical protein